MAGRWGLLLVLLVLLAEVSAVWILPGVAPTNYYPTEADGSPAKVELKVNKMTSPRTQLPYGYYSLAFCRPDDLDDVRENLGEMLMGDRIENSKYDVRSPVCSIPGTDRLTSIRRFRCSRTCPARSCAGKSILAASCAPSRSASMRSITCTGA